MQWIKAFHIIVVIAWFAGIFYLPRLFVYHAMSDDAISNARFKIMERKLFYGIMTPSALLTLLSGLYLLHYYWDAIPVLYWLQLKLVLVGLLIGYHSYCGKLLHDFKHDRNQHSHVFYRWLNEIPVILLAGIVILVVVKPF